MTRHARSERLLLADELERIGPDAPTLCEGWRTRDLALHLVLRDGRPDLIVGTAVPFVKDRVRAARRDLAADYPGLVERFRSGAPAWNPTSFSRADELANLVEFLVHHEDVRRAQPDWAPRELDADLQAATWTALRRTARLMFRKARTGVVLVAPGIGRYSAKLPDRAGTVVLRGEPLELLLFAYGRGTHAAVRLEGQAEDVVALRDSVLGLG